MAQIIVDEPSEKDGWRKGTIQKIIIEEGMVRLAVKNHSEGWEDSFSIPTERFREVMNTVAPAPSSPREYLVGEVVWYRY